MLEILIGMIVLFLILCFVWEMLHFLGGKVFDSPKVIKIIGKVEIIIFAITFVLAFSYGIGKVMLGG